MKRDLQKPYLPKEPLEGSRADRKDPASDVQSFVQNYKTAYSHGLEKIYALEDVDIRSVRRICNDAPSMALQEFDPPCSPEAEEAEAQLQFDFGERFRETLEHFVLQEPVHVLGLTKHAEKALASFGKNTLKDLLATDLRELIYVKGIGQGHIDEIRHKLLKYVEGKNLYKTRKVDFISWIRSLTAEHEAKKNYVALERFELSDLCSLSPLESIEVRRLTIEKRQEWAQEAMDKWRNPHKVQQISQDLQKVMDIFIKPWMRRRLDIATGVELHERLECISSSSLRAEKALKFFSRVYFKDEFPLSHYLYRLDENLYGCSSETAGMYHSIVNQAYSYFYKTHIHYSLKELVWFILRDGAKQWTGYPEGFVEKALRVCPRFRVRKGENQLLMIKLA